MIELTLPWPPSVNHYWARNKNGGMRVGQKGVAFRDAVQELVFDEVGFLWLKSKNAQNHITFKTERLKVVVEAHAPDKRRRDLDNVQKALLDSLTHAGVWGDDDQVDDLRIFWARDAAGKKCIGGMVKVRVEVLA